MEHVKEAIFAKITIYDSTRASQLQLYATAMTSARRCYNYQEMILLMKNNENN